MSILLVFAFISGLITIFAPCVWPLLPLILSTTATGGHRKPIGVVLGIVISFGILMLTLSYVIRIIPFDPEILRYISVIVILFLGLTLLIPALSQTIEGFVSRISGRFAEKFVGSKSNGFWGGLLTGLVLGIVWTPCAGPILASIATLSATTSVNLGIILVTIAYMAGVAIPLLIFAVFGRYIFTKSRALSKYTGVVQRIFGVILIATAVLIFTGFDRVLQVKLLDAIPAYSNFLDDFESNDSVTRELDRLKGDVVVPDFNMPGSEGDLLNANYPAPEITGINNWLQSEPLKISELKGKVVLIDFWTYTCINCIRTLPHITSWDEKYRDDGLVIIGVHTPEFEFEKKTKNVEEALEQYNIKYPVAQDNDFRTWRAFNNRFWPAKYLIDKEGNVRRTHFGEGEYEETEEAIQMLLSEDGPEISKEIDPSNPTFNRSITHEAYLGSQRMQYFHPNGRLPRGTREYELSKSIPLSTFSLGGKWNIMPEYSGSVENSVLELNFRAQDVFLVMRSKEGTPKKVKIIIDGEVPSDVAGADVIDGEVIVESDRLYELIKLPEVETRKLRLEFEDGIEAFAFTFG